MYSKLEHPFLLIFVQLLSSLQDFSPHSSSIRPLYLVDVQVFRRTSYRAHTFKAKSPLSSYPVAWIQETSLTHSYPSCSSNSRLFHISHSHNAPTFKLLLPSQLLSAMRHRTINVSLVHHLHLQPCLGQTRLLPQYGHQTPPLSAINIRLTYILFLVRHIFHLPHCSRLINFQILACWKVPVMPVLCSICQTAKA